MRAEKQDIRLPLRRSVMPRPEGRCPRTGSLLQTSRPYRLAFAALLWVTALAIAVPGAFGNSSGTALAEVRNPDGVAVIIGNRDYTHRDVPEVTFAHLDADAFGRYVVDVLGYDPDNIIDLRDATRGELFDALGSRTDPHGLLWSYLNPEGGSDVVVFYSGHGVPGLNDGRGYLLPVDTNPKEAEHDGYPIDLLYENVGGLAEAETVQVYLDACFSGSSAGGAVIKDASPVYLTPKLPEGVGDKVVSLTAASGKQVASWDKEVKHGLFTYHLLDALYGGADENDDHSVTALEAKAYLDKHMTRAARRQHRRVQEASLLGTDSTVLAALLVIVEPPIENPSDTTTDDWTSNPVAVTGGNAFLVVETDPPGASVLVDGARVGETPLELHDLRAGTFTVTLDHPTHETVVLEDQVLADKRVLDIRRALQPATGEVTVLTQPSGGWVEHDGERVADSTPVTLKGLPSGSMVLTVGAAGHRPVEVEVQVPKNGVALVNRKLEEIEYGTLTLVLEPADARVTLTDGHATYHAGMRLVDGEHRVRVTREGYQEVSRVVTVLGDTRARIVLRPDKLEEPPAPTPEAEEALLGLKRDELRRIQRSLISLGFYGGPADGLLGEESREALKKWQSSHNLAATGFLDADSAKALLAVQPETSITVRTVPPNAKVRVFTASGSTYQDAMNVQPGRYEVAVDAPHHEPFRERLSVEGPTTYKISLCKLEEKTERVCKDKPVTRTKSVTKKYDKRIERRVVGSIPADLILRKKAASIPYATLQSEVQKLCLATGQRARESIRASCKSLNGRAVHGSFRVVREDCDPNKQETHVVVVGSMLCKGVPRVSRETYTGTEKECRNAIKEVRNCPSEMVTKLR